MAYKCIVFDLDGTIYFGSKPAFMAQEIIAKARQHAQHVFFVTNNSAKTRQQLFEKLTFMNIDVKLDEIINSGYAVAKYLSDNNYKNVYSISAPSMKQEISSFGIDPVSKNPEAVVVGYTPDFRLGDLTELLNIEKKQGYKLIIANRERSYPGNDGLIMPGAGPVVSAVENALNKNTDFVIGKPNPLMLETMTKGLDIKPEEICVIGDSFESDVKMARDYGADSFLIAPAPVEGCRCVEKLADLAELL